MKYTWCNVWARYFVWNFTGYLRALRFKTSKVLFNPPPPPPPPPPPRRITISFSPFIRAPTLRNRLPIAPPILGPFGDYGCFSILVNKAAKNWTLNMKISNRCHCLGSYSPYLPIVSIVNYVESWGKEKWKHAQYNGFFFRKTITDQNQN